MAWLSQALPGGFRRGLQQVCDSRVPAEDEPTFGHPRPGRPSV